MTNNTPAHKIFIDTSTEWRLLAALIKEDNAEYINKISDRLFTDNRIPVFKAIQGAYVSYGEVTYEGIKQYLKNNIPGELLAAPISNIDALIDESIRLAKKRLLIEKAQELKELSYEFNPSDNDISKVLEVESIMAPEDSSLDEGAQDFLSDLEKKLRGDYIYVSTGFAFLDSAMAGEWNPKSLVILMGASGSGKTVMVGNSMIRMAKQGHSSLFISLEMEKDDLMTRWIADELDIDSRRIRQPEKLTEDQIKRIEDKTKELQRMPMYMLTNGTMTITQMTYYIRQHVKKKNIRTVFIDYLQLVNHHPSGIRNYDLGDFSRKMKKLAKDLDICIVILTQVNRGHEGMDALRDSGEVQNVSDVMFQIIPDDTPNGNDPNKNVVVHFWKNRLGPLPMVPLLFVGKYQRFEDGEY